MKAKIVHESQGRLRLALPMKQMSLEQAELLEATLAQQAWAVEVKVHERTCSVVLSYHEGCRADAIRAVASFSWDTAQEAMVNLPHSSRALNREYEEKLVMKVTKKLIFHYFMPNPLRIARVCLHMVPFLRRGLWCVWHRQMKVELLDALSVGISAIQLGSSTNKWKTECIHFFLLPMPYITAPMV